MNNDLIRKSDVLAEMRKHAKGKIVLGGQTYQSLTLEVALDAIRALPAVTPKVKPLVWSPIETAPKDQMILGYEDGMVRLVLWERGVWCQVGATIEQGWFEPEYWMPLPQSDQIASDPTSDPRV